MKDETRALGATTLLGLPMLHFLVPDSDRGSFD